MTKLWRTTIRVTDVFIDSVEIVIPAWEYGKTRIHISFFPDNMIGTVMPGYRFYADVNLSAENESDLELCNFREG